MDVVVIEAHLSNYPDPLRLVKGESVVVGEPDREFPGWVWVSTTRGKEGWAPRESISCEEGSSQGVALCNYSARELNTQPGERFTVIRELHGWYEVTDARSRKGWVPKSAVRPVDS